MLIQKKCEEILVKEFSKKDVDLKFLDLLLYMVHTQDLICFLLNILIQSKKKSISIIQFWKL